MLARLLPAIDALCPGRADRVDCLGRADRVDCLGKADRVDEDWRGIARWLLAAGLAFCMLDLADFTCLVVAMSVATPSFWVRCSRRRYPVRAQAISLE